VISERKELWPNGAGKAKFQSTSIIYCLRSIIKVQIPERDTPAAIIAHNLATLDNKKTFAGGATKMSGTKPQKKKDTVGHEKQFSEA
jgi:hypothetical protein